MKKNYLLLLVFLIAGSTLSAQLVLNEVLYDPVEDLGDANRDGTVDFFDDEFVEFVNTSNIPLDISGYKIYDRIRFEELTTVGDNPRHLVPANTIIPANGIYVVFGGTVNNLDVDLTNIRTAFPGVIFQTASSGSLDLQNAGDDIYVTDGTTNTPIISFKPEELSLNMGINQSAARKTNISGVFVRHLGINKDLLFSPGEQLYFTDTFPLILNETLFDGNGDANEDGTESFFDDEFIEFVNNTGESVDISGYKIFDLGSLIGTSAIPVRHIIPANTIIPKDGVYLLFGGGTPGSNTGSNFGNSIVQVASSTSLNLSNNDEIIFILDESDNLVFSLDYSEIGLDMGINQSATRSPDITGNFVLHGDVLDDVNFSPGTKPNGSSLSTDDFKLFSNNVKIFKMNKTTLKIEGLSKGKINLRLVDLLGKQVLKKVAITDGIEEILLPRIKTGLYILQIENNTLKLNKKILIE